MESPIRHTSHQSYAAGRNTSVRTNDNPHTIINEKDIIRTAFYYAEWIQDKIRIARKYIHEAKSHVGFMLVLPTNARDEVEIKVYTNGKVTMCFLCSHILDDGRKALKLSGEFIMPDVVFVNLYLEILFELRNKYGETIERKELEKFFTSMEHTCFEPKA